MSARRAGSERHAGVAFFVARADSLDGAPGLRVDSIGPGHGGIRLRGNQLAGGAVEDVEESVLRRVKENFSRDVPDDEVSENNLRGGIEVPDVPGSFLIMPDVHARVGLERDDRAGVKIVAALRTARVLAPGSA